MTDSLARIAAEQTADHALEASHPDPLAIAGELRSRAADRCARKRALWAADWCVSCPWKGCAGCAYQGGVDPAKGANSLVVWDNSSGREAAPGGAGNTFRGPDHDSTPRDKRGGISG